MRRFGLIALLFVSACGPDMVWHHNTPAQSQSNGNTVCDDDSVDPRGTPRLNNCRLKSDVDADKRAATDAINYGQLNQRTR